MCVWLAVLIHLGRRAGLAILVGGHGMFSGVGSGCFRKVSFMELNG